VIILQVVMCLRIEKIKPEGNVGELRGALAKHAAGQREASGTKFVFYAAIN
jgi:hypothetical protein